MTSEQNSSLLELKRGLVANSLPDKYCRVYDDGILRVEHDNYYVSCGGQRVLLPRKDFLLLSRLARNPERVVTTCDLWQHAWGTNEPVNSRTLRVHIYHIRRKLAPFGIKIENMTNVGYCLSVKTAAFSHEKAG